MTVPYTPAGHLPADAKQLVAAMLNELAALKRGLEAAWDYSEQRYRAAEPARMRAGMLVLADGVNWNPGSGEGMYRRNAANTAWVHLG